MGAALAAPFFEYVGGNLGHWKDKAGNIIATVDGENRKLIIPASSEIEVAGTSDFQAAITIASGGLTVTAGGLTLTAGQASLTTTRTVASAASADLKGISLPATTITLTGTTQVTAAQGYVHIARPVLTDASAVTVDTYASLYIANAPNTGGSVTLTSPYALWVDDGATRLDGALTAAAGITVTTGGVTVTAGGLTITAGGLLITAGRIREILTPTDVDAQNNTLTVAQIVAGIVVHTSVTGGGTVTTDTAANIIAGSGGVAPLTADGQCLVCYYVNDGDQTLTFAGGTNVTVADTGNTIATNEAATLIFRRTGAAAVTLYII